MGTHLEPLVGVWGVPLVVRRSLGLHGLPLLEPLQAAGHAAGEYRGGELRGVHRGAREAREERGCAAERHLGRVRCDDRCELN